MVAKKKNLKVIEAVEIVDPAFTHHKVAYANWFHTINDGTRVVNTVSHLLLDNGRARCGLPLTTKNVWKRHDSAPVTCTTCRKTLKLAKVSYDEARAHMAFLPAPVEAPSAPSAPVEEKIAA